MHNICLAKCQSPWHSFILAFLLLSLHSSASSTADVLIIAMMSLIIAMMSRNIKEKQQYQAAAIKRKEMRGWSKTFFFHLSANLGRTLDLSKYINGKLKSEMWPRLAERWRSWISQRNNNKFCRSLALVYFDVKTACRSSFSIMNLNKTTSTHIYKGLS